MYTFLRIDLNKKYNINNQIKEQNVIYLYELSFNDKNQFKKEFNKIKEHRKQNKLSGSSILVHIKKIENSLSGTIAQLKQSFDIVITSAENTKISRFLLESTQIDYLIDPQDEKLRESTHNFNSGLNQVLVQIAKEKDKGILFTTNSFMRREKIDTRIIGKIQQNMIMLEKKKVPYTFIQIVNTLEDKKTDLKYILPFFNIKNKKHIIEQKTISEKLFNSQG